MDTLKLQSLATRDGDNYILKGSKIWTSTAQTAQKILILVRTTPLEQVTKPTQGLSLFYTDLDREVVSVTEIHKLGRAAVDSNSLSFEGWKVPKSDLIGNEGDGFKLILQGLNAERCLIGAEALGLGFAGLRGAAAYAQEREVFGRAIGKNQGIQHPLAESWMKLEAARLMLYHAARLYDEGYESGEYAKSAKYLCAEAEYSKRCNVVQCRLSRGDAKHPIFTAVTKARKFRLVCLTSFNLANAIAGLAHRLDQIMDLLDPHPKIPGRSPVSSLFHEDEAWDPAA